VSLIRIPPEFFEFSSLSLHPKTTFTSSSKAQDGSNVAHTAVSHMSGSARVSARPSPFIKESTDFKIVYDQLTFVEGDQTDVTNDLESLSRYVLSASRDSVHNTNGVNISKVMSKIMDTVHSRSILPRNTKELPIKRYGASDFFHEIRGFTNEDAAREYDFTALATGSIVKSMIRNSLMQFYRGSYDSCDYSYTNYHSLNFFTASNVPSDSALIYPNSGSLRGYSTLISMNPGLGGGFRPGTRRGGSNSTSQSPRGGASNPAASIPTAPTAGGSQTSGIEVQASTPPYVLSGSFTFDFYINPRYHNGSSDRDFKAGTILHLPNYYAISLISGSDKDENGLTRGYRILFQLAESCEHWEPSQVQIVSASVPEPGTEADSICFSSRFRNSGCDGSCNGLCRSFICHT